MYRLGAAVQSHNCSSRTKQTTFYGNVQAITVRWPGVAGARAVKSRAFPLISLSTNSF
jgi:hypothetical protein